MQPRFAVMIALALVIPAFGARAHAQDAASKKASSLGDTIELGTVAQNGGALAWGRAEGVVDARSEAVVAVLSDYSQYAGFLPYFEKSKILSQRGSDAIVYLEAEVLNGAATLWSQVRMSAKLNGATTVVEARMMKGKGNIDQLLARWEVTPVANGEKSLVTFQLLVDPDLPIPDVLVTGEMKKGAGQAMRALRKRVAQRESFASRPATSM